MGCVELKGDRRDNTTYGHAKQPSDIMLQLEVLIGKGLGAVYTGATCTVAVQEISTLYHEVFNLGFESANKPSFEGPRGMEKGKTLTTR